MPSIVQVNEYKYEIERLVRELTDMKKKYYDNKRREQVCGSSALFLIRHEYLHNMTMATD